jgi:hypothetical protein
VPNKWNYHASEIITLSFKIYCHTFSKKNLKIKTVKTVKNNFSKKEIKNVQANIL